MSGNHNVGVRTVFVTGFGLKTKTKSWDEAFNEHQFTKREKQLMRNFNIKYECFDAHDDF